jgi:hypothetical protein
MKQLVEIDEATFVALAKLAAEKGFSSVEELLTAFAKDFSTGCSVTLGKTDAA